MIGQEVWEWIARELAPRQCGSTEFIYDLQESQSGGSLPLIYQPFDAANPAHWADRGSAWGSPPPSLSMSRPAAPCLEGRCSIP